MELANYWRRCRRLTRSTAAFARWIRLKPHRIETFKLSDDPKFGKQVRDIVGFYVNPPEPGDSCSSSAHSVAVRVRTYSFSCRRAAIRAETVPHACRPW
jgi:hypothetical protein